MSDLAFSLISALVIIGVSGIYLTYVMWKEDQDDV
jgi:hypothetical protein